MVAEKPAGGATGSGRCTGHCCRRFFLIYSPAELERAEAARVAGASSWATDAGDTMGILQDIEIIATMVIHLGPDEAKAEEREDHVGDG